MRQTVPPTVTTLAACLLISLMEATDFPALESIHLLSRSEVVSPTLFENVSPDESGLRYIKPSHWKKEHHHEHNEEEYDEEEES